MFESRMMRGCSKKKDDKVLASIVKVCSDIINLVHLNV
jgi:hypothetical protein